LASKCKTVATLLPFLAFVPSDLSLQIAVVEDIISSKLANDPHHTGPPLKCSASNLASLEHFRRGYRPVRLKQLYILSAFRHFYCHHRNAFLPSFESLKPIRISCSCNIMIGLSKKEIPCRWNATYRYVKTLIRRAGMWICG